MQAFLAGTETQGMDERANTNLVSHPAGGVRRPSRVTAARALMGLSLLVPLVGGCSALRPPVAASDLVAFSVAAVNPPQPLTPARSGQVISVPPGFDISVRVRPANASVRALHVTTLAYVPDCHGRPVPEAYRTKRIVMPSVDPDALSQDWDLSKFTLSWLNLCPDPTQPAYPTPVALAGTLTLHAVAEDAGGAVSQGNLTVVVQRPGGAAAPVEMPAAPVPRAGTR